MNRATKSSSGKNQSILFGIATICVLILIGVSYLAYQIYVQQKELEKSLDSESVMTSDNTVLPTPTPTPAALLHGKETYTISQGPTVTGPKIVQAIIDPLDPNVRAKQTITVHVLDTQNVQGVTLLVHTDTKDTELPLALSSGTPTDGQWSTTWEVPETYLYRYTMEISAKGAKETSHVELTMRGK